MDKLQKKAFDKLEVARKKLAHAQDVFDGALEDAQKLDAVFSGGDARKRYDELLDLYVTNDSDPDCREDMLIWFNSRYCLKLTEEEVKEYLNKEKS